MSKSSSISNDLRKAAKVMYLVTEKDIAESVDLLLTSAALWIDRLQAENEDLKKNKS